MSEEQLKAFQEAVRANPSLRDQLNEAVDPESVVAIAKTSGFNISVEDLGKKPSDLSDDDLEYVAGGFIVVPTIGGAQCRNDYWNNTGSDWGCSSD